MAHLAHYREAHPLPFVVTHWINLICMFGLIFTGFLIHYPFIASLMGIARGLHLTCGCIILVNLIVRLVMAFRIKDAQFGGTRETGDYDYKNFLPSKVNRHQFGPWMKYYLFIKKKHPISTKYGSPQKLSYFLIPILLICSGLTGFSMWGPTSVWPMFEAITDFLGGPMGVRIVHYFLMWLFIIFIIIHIYLATVEGTAPVKLMFIHKESPGLVVDPTNGKVIGEDNSPVVGGKLMSKEEIEDLFNASRADEETQETQESS